MAFPAEARCKETPIRDGVPPTMIVPLNFNINEDGYS
jgi:hypothetical protein